MTQMQDVQPDGRLLERDTPPTAESPPAQTHDTPLRAKLMAPRWYKVLGDIWGSKLRSILVILSIAIGTFAVGAIAEARIKMLEGLNSAYQATSPFTGIVGVPVESAFDDELVEAIEKIEGVALVEGRSPVSVRLKIGPDEWADLQIRSVPDWDDITIGTFQREQGQLPFNKGEIALERSGLGIEGGGNFAVGDTIIVETRDRDIRELVVTGSVHDLSAPPAFLFGDYNGYIDEESLEWLGGTTDYTQIQFVVEEELFDDPERVDAIFQEILNQIERTGRETGLSFLPPNPGTSPIANFVLEPLVFLLGALGVLMAFLSGFLVANTISGLLAQQVRQIGVLKAIGATTGQVAGLYLWTVTIFGVLAMVVAVPLAHVVAGRFAVFFGTFLNFDPATGGLLPPVLAVQAFLALAVPLLAAIIPITRTSNISIRDALDNGGGSSYGTGIIDRILQSVRGVPRPLLLSLRNTFRRKGRLALTLVTLVLAGAIFISVSTVQASIDLSLSNLFSTLVRYDVQVSLERPYRIDQVEQVIAEVPGVVAIENTNTIQARRLRPDDTEGDSFNFQGVNLAVTQLEPRIVEGRWLLPSDENALVVNSSYFNDEDDIRVGDTVTLTFDGRETEWVIVGSYQGLSSFQLTNYANADYFGQIVREVGETRRVQVTIADTGNAEAQTAAAAAIEEQLRDRGLRIAETQTASTQFQFSERQFGLIVILTTAMAILIALVGGMGLAGTMSINVLERTREIGVMRAIGASTPTLLFMILAEGIMIGLISWFLGGLIAVPLSQLLSNQVGVLFTGAPLIYTFSVGGVVQWFIGVVVLATIASALPAWNAIRLTVRDIISYDG